MQQKSVLFHTFFFVVDAYVTHNAVDSGLLTVQIQLCYASGG